MDLLNILFALLSIGFGLIGWFAPGYTMKTLDLAEAPGEGRMGPSEIRASGGALFVGMGLGAMILATPAAFAMIGFCWLGAAAGRLTSLLRDGQSRKKWVFFAVEVVVGLGAIAWNL